jgi:hypothetical protein
MRHLPAILAALALAACKGDPPAAPAEPAARAPALPVAPIHVPHQGDDQAAARYDDGMDESAPAPAPSPQPAPVAQDPVVLQKQLAHLDSVIASSQHALEQATDVPSRQKAQALLTAMRKRRNDLAAQIGAPPTTGPALSPNAPAR